MSLRLTLIATEKQKKFYHHEEHEAPEGLRSEPKILSLRRPRRARRGKKETAKDFFTMKGMKRLKEKFF
jgi:hypothetical protein